VFRPGCLLLSLILSFGEFKPWLWQRRQRDQRSSSTNIFSAQCIFVKPHSFEGSKLECQQGKGVYLAAGATVLFFLAACFHCLSPRPDPFCNNFGRPTSEPGTIQNVQNSGGPAPVVTQKPQMIHTNENGGSVCESEVLGASHPEKTSTKKKTRTSSDKKKIVVPNSMEKKV
jgi:hypothetical protein